MAKMTDDKYVEYVNTHWQQWEDAMRDYIDDIWPELWQLYQNRQDWKDKQDWQSKAFVPKLMMQVEKASGMVKRAVMQTRRLVKFELDDTAERERIQELREAKHSALDPDELAYLEQEIKKVEDEIELKRGRMQMRERQFKRKLEESTFASVYSEQIKACFLLGIGIPKALWSDGLHFEHVDAMNCAISPDHVPNSRKRPPFLIERQEIELSRFKVRVKNANKLARQSGLKPPWNNKEVKKLVQAYHDMEARESRNRRMGLGEHLTSEKKVVLKYYWGDVINDDEETVEENQLLVVANDAHLVRRQDNPFDHGKIPHEPTYPMVYPHRGTHGISLVAPLVRLQYLQNNIVNLVADNLNFSVNKTFEYNPMDIANPNALRAMYPGKMVQVNTQGGQQAVREVVTSAIKRDALYFYELIDREQQEGSSVTEFNSGLPGKKSKTLGEVELKTAQSQGLFDNIARDLESESLQPLLERSYDLCVQFERWEPRQGFFTMVVSGLTIILMQQEMVQNLSSILGYALQSPVLGEMTELQMLWKKLLDVYNLSSAYKDAGEQADRLSPEQEQNVVARAESDARQAVAQMSPERILQMAGRAGPQEQTGA